MLKNRYEIMALVQAVMCNPNGDPDMDNRPRMDLETGYGVITDVCFKSRIRRAVEMLDPSQEMLFRDGNSLNRDIAKAAFEANGVDSFKGEEFRDKNPRVAETAALIAQRFYDARTFGAVLSSGLNGGQLRGPVQVAMANSIDPINVEDITITRNSYTDGQYKTLKEYDDADANRPDEKKRTMGDKKYIPYGLYTLKATVSANLAQKTGFDENDLKLLIEGIMQMYSNDISASKMGMSVLSPVIIFKHVGTQDENNAEDNEREAMLGCAPAYKLFELLDVKKKDDVEYPRSYKDYDAAFHLSKLPKGVNVGFKTGPFQNIQWGSLQDEWLKMD